MIIFCDENNEGLPDEFCYATQVVVSEENMSVESVGDDEMRLSGQQVMEMMMDHISTPVEQTTSDPPNVSFHQSLSKLSTPSTKERVSSIINQFINSNWMSKKKPAADLSTSNSNQATVSFPVPQSTMFNLQDPNMHFE